MLLVMLRVVWTVLSLCWRLQRRQYWRRLLMLLLVLLLALVLVLLLLVQRRLLWLPLLILVLMLVIIDGICRPRAALGWKLRHGVCKSVETRSEARGQRA